LPCEYYLSTFCQGIGKNITMGSRNIMDEIFKWMAYNLCLPSIMIL
jgi:hypothetical protein